MKKVLMPILVGIFGCLPVRAQVLADSACIYYRAGYRYVEPGYRNNRAELDRFTETVRQALRNGVLDRIVVRAGASPDGSQRANEQLAKYRADSLAAYLVNATGVPGDVIERQTAGILWGRLRDQVASSDMPYRDEVLRILDQEPLWTFDERHRVVGSRKKSLMDLRGGRPYNYMREHFFPDLRNSASLLLALRSDTSVKSGLPEGSGAPAAPQTECADAQPAPRPDTPAVAEHPVGTASPAPASRQPLPALPAAEEWRPAIRIKTNAIGWAMMLANVAVEIDISRRLSFNLPIYYSACDYFTSTVKFRMLGTQPELRFWPLRERRFFAGLHFGVASYNMALGGDWRIQDHGGNTPAWGGGINLGYRIPLGRSERWNVEFSLGAGVYKARYDKFRNESGGACVSTVRKTFVGLDNAAISFSYMFDLKKTRK